MRSLLPYALLCVGSAPVSALVCVGSAGALLLGPAARVYRPRLASRAGALRMADSDFDAAFVKGGAAVAAGDFVEARRQFELAVRSQ